ncbi:hypothetical protein C1646_685463 [Rhizophagus diaphanus]|nr:hypothetical protein C1646_685463 [Rhizophagus diaphanus] [Rhizophagus sp. MUCL 43196]
MALKEMGLSTVETKLKLGDLRRFRISFILFGLIFTAEAFGIIANKCNQVVKVAAFVGIYISFGYLPLRKNESVITEQDRSNQVLWNKIKRKNLRKINTLTLYMRFLIISKLIHNKIRIMWRV